MLFLWFYHACRRNSPRFLMVSDHINYLTFEDPGAVNTVRRALKLAHAGDLYGAAETAGVDVAHAAVVSEGLRRGMRYSIGAEVDNDPRSRPDAQNIVDAMRPDGIIRSVHFLTIEHPEKGGEYSWPYDNPELVHYFDAVGVERVWELYMARLLEDVEKLPGHIVGHFYKPAMFGHWPDDAKLDRYENQILDAAAARGMAIEINTRMLYRDPQTLGARLVDAYKRLMRKAKAKNVAIAIGSDAHSPKDQGGAFDLVLSMLDECEVNEIVFPVAGRLARVALRATKEHIEQQQKTQEPAQPGSSISGLSRAELGLPDEPVRDEAAGSKTGRDAGPKKRASSPARTSKKPEPEDLPAKSSSRRSAQSAASSAKAKETAGKTQTEKEPPKPAKEPAAKTKPAKATVAKEASPAKAAPVKAAPVKAAPVKAAAKVAPSKAPSAKAAPAKKTVAVKKAAKSEVKPAAKKASLKPVAKAAAKKAPAKKLAVKTVSKPAAKAPAKKAVVKKASAPSKKAPVKKTAAKPAPKAKKPATKSAVKTAAKKPAAKKKIASTARPVKKSAKPAAKKSSTKRR
jgi:HisJ family histidinol phosphate phosphatase